MKKILEKIFIDGFSALTVGMFVTLIMGTATGQIGAWMGGHIGQMLMGIGNVARTLTGAGVGVALAAKYKSGTLVTVSAAIAGMMGAFGSLTGISFGMAGEPIGAFVAAIVAVEVGQLVSGKTNFDIIVTPVVSLLAGGAVGYFASPYITRFIYFLARFAGTNILEAPVLGGMIIASVFCLFSVLPVNAVAIAATVGLSSLGFGAATVGMCCGMIGFAVMSFDDTKAGGTLSQGLFSAVLQFPNVIKKPLILLPALISAVILGPVSSALLKMIGTAQSAGVGSMVFIGQVATWRLLVNSTPPVIVMIEIALMHFLLPGLISISVYKVMRKLNWIKKGDLKLRV